MTALFSKMLRQRINKAAHRLAAQQEATIRRELAARLEAARDAGGTLEDLSRLLADLEAGRVALNCGPIE